MTRLLHLRLLSGVLRRLRGGDRDRGVALASVIGLGTVLLLLSVTMISVAVSGTVKARGDSDFNAAIAAAYAGVEDYQSKLANNNAYSQYGVRATSFSAGSSFTGTNGNPAFGAGKAGSWQTVPGSDASYRYEVDTSQYSTKGSLRLRSTGRVGDTTRSVVADLKQDGFLDYVYFTDFEISDPALSSAACSPAYEWAVASRPSCTTIQFAPGDVINGPLHTNDTMVVCGGPQFLGTTTTASTRPNRFTAATGSSCTGTPVFGKDKKSTPDYAAQITMPQTNDKMKQETRSDLTGSTVPNPGCLYTGPTSITLNGDGTMTVYSPWTKSTQLANAAETGSAVNPSKCGIVGERASGGTLGSPGGQTLPVLDGNLVYVQDVPTALANVNARLGTAVPTKYSCTGADGVVAGNGVGFPAVGETGASYGCTTGDVFVKGTLKGTMTIAASNYVYVTGDVLLADSARDMLGLVGTNAVYVYNPTKTYSTTTTRYRTEYYTCYYYGFPYSCSRDVPYDETSYSTGLMDRSKSDRTIQAAILSVAHTFTVQNYNQDGGYPKGKLNVLGSISQKFRGPVATTGSTGYQKQYVYDPRMRYTAPPKFLSPVSTSYGVTHIVESQTAVDWTGKEIVP
jgi:hypothetical protein